MNWDQDKRESDFLKSQHDPDRVRRDIGEGRKKEGEKSSVNREENDEKV